MAPICTTHAEAVASYAAGARAQRATPAWDVGSCSATVGGQRTADGLHNVPRHHHWRLDRRGVGTVSFDQRLWPLCQHDHRAAGDRNRRHARVCIYIISHRKAALGGNALPWDHFAQRPGCKSKIEVTASLVPHQPDGASQRRPWPPTGVVAIPSPNEAMSGIALAVGGHRLSLPFAHRQPLSAFAVHVLFMQLKDTGPRRTVFAACTRCDTSPRALWHRTTRSTAR